MALMAVFNYGIPWFVIERQHWVHKNALVLSEESMYLGRLRRRRFDYCRARLLR